MSDVMRFEDIKERFLKFRDIEVAMLQTLDTLSAQERIRESVPVRYGPAGLKLPEPEPVRSPEPAGPTLAEQLSYMRKIVGSLSIATTAMDRAILASLERLAREGSHDKK